MSDSIFDSLEARRLLAATFNSGTGLLLVSGSLGNDTINLTLVSGNIHVTITPEGYDDSFSISGMNGIQIGGDDGNDRIDVDVAITLPTTLDGDNGQDTIFGGGGDDSIFGGADDDVVDGRAGSDTFDGGTGFDALDYISRTAAISATLDGVQNDGQSGENDQILTTIDIIRGGSGNDTIDATGAPANPRVFYGEGGNDTLIGSSSDDRLIGGGGDDSLNGVNGNDTLIGSGGNDILIGGAGLDTASYYYYGNPVTATLGAASGNGAGHESDNIGTDIEVLEGGQNNDVLTGTSRSDTIYGNGGNDTLTGLNGNDYLTGGSGKDYLNGGNGADKLRGNSNGDRLIGGGGAGDVVSYSERTDGVTAIIGALLSSGVGGASEGDTIDDDVEILDGCSGNDSLTGNSRDNTLLGNAGNDTLVGLAGDDSLVGGTGNDSFLGGDGIDHIRAVDGLADIIDGGNGVDDILSDLGLDVVTNP